MTETTESATRSNQHRRVPLPLPRSDELALHDALGVKGYVDDAPPAQFVRFGLETGLFDLLAERGPLTIDGIAADTYLTPLGADTLTAILVALGVLRRDGDTVSLSAEAADYLVSTSPYFQGRSLCFSTTPMQLPKLFVDFEHPTARSVRFRGRRLAHRAAWETTRLLGRQPTSRWPGWGLGGDHRLENQHARNLASCAAAARLSLFDDARCVVDVGGGTGPLAVPLHRLHPEMRIVLTDLPDALPEIRPFLDRQDAADIEVVAMDVLGDRWDIPPCDVLFLGNLIHIFNDRRTGKILERSARHLRESGGGTVVLHELVFDEDRTGPLKAALFHFTMASMGGKQRTVTELHQLLAEAGFGELFAHPTAGGFAAVGGSIG